MQETLPNQPESPETPAPAELQVAEPGSMKQKLLAAITVVLLFVFYGSFLAHKINLVTADLGRHIRNGEFLSQDSKVLTTNFYSYTEPEYPVINHHWASGFIFYALDKVGGLKMVHVFFIAISLAAFAIYFLLAKKFSSLGAALVCAIPMVFLLAERTEIRPEVFSYFFAGLFLWILYKFRSGEYSYKALLVLPFLHVLWVNTHIFFILGPIIVGAFLVESLFTDRRRLARLGLLLGAVAIASAINPFGLKGAVEPLFIMRDFGYPLAENQTVLFMQKLTANPTLRIYPIIFFLVLASFAAVLVKDRKKFVLVNFFLFAGFSFLAWYQIRNIAFFGFVVLPIAAANIQILFPKADDFRLQKAGLAILLIVLVTAASGNLLRYFPYWQKLGIGPEPGNEAAAIFFKDAGIQGPIFNNYDIGGYLIYHLFPEEKVFVDNRPKEYGAKFFRDIYIPMQENADVWRAKDTEYAFNAIFFSHRDATPWGQKFLHQRAADPDWATVYFDQYVIIMVKRNPQNEKIINNNSRV